MQMAKNKREIIAELIEAGGATKESLMIGAEVNSAGLSSQFTYLRLTGKFPVKADDGTFKFISEEEWTSMKEAAGSRSTAAGPKKAPKEVLETLLKRQAKLQEAYAKRQEAGDKSPIGKLKLKKAEVEVDIINLEITAIQTEINASSESV